MYRYLAKGKKQRGKRYGRKVGSGKYVEISLIEQRPKEVKTGRVIGHWEGDTIGFGSSKYENITTLEERKTRFTKRIKNSSRVSNEVMNSIKIFINKLPRKLGRTLTLDQGYEFANFRLIEKNTKCKVYFCYAHSPWQRGTNENTNGRLRRYLPRNIEIQKKSRDA